MVTNEQTLFYRKKVQNLLQSLRYAIYIDSGRNKYPTDISLAFLLGLSPTAFSALSRGCSSMNGIILLRCFELLSKYLSESQFMVVVREFVS